jgi:hypothetical protein
MRGSYNPPASTALPWLQSLAQARGPYTGEDERIVDAGAAKAALSY